MIHYSAQTDAHIDPSGEVHNRVEIRNPVLHRRGWYGPVGICDVLPTVPHEGPVNPTRRFDGMYSNTHISLFGVSY